MNEIRVQISKLDDDRYCPSKCDVVIKPNSICFGEHEISLKEIRRLLAINEAMM
jgi:hypothetical protein